MNQKSVFNHPPENSHSRLSYPSLKSYPNKKFQGQLVNASFYGRRFVHFGLAIHPWNLRWIPEITNMFTGATFFQTTHLWYQNFPLCSMSSSVLLWASLRRRPLFWCRNGLHLRHWHLVHPGKVDAGLRVAWWLQPTLCLLWTEILIEYAQPDMQFWKNYQPYPLKYPLANTLLPKEIFLKKNGMLNENNFRY